jgi:hypothetical protein
MRKGMHPCERDRLCEQNLSSENVFPSNHNAPLGPSGPRQQACREVERKRDCGRCVASRARVERVWECEVAREGQVALVQAIHEGGVYASRERAAEVNVSRPCEQGVACKNGGWGSGALGL